MKDKKRQIIIGFLLMMSLLLVTLGVSVSFFSYVRKGSTENSVKLGSITFKYTENSNIGNGIMITEALPITDEVGKIQSGEGKIFDFKVESNLSRSDLEYEIVAQPTENNTIPLDAVKFYLTNVTDGTEEELLSTIGENGKVKTLDEYSDTTIKNATGKTIYQETILRNTKGYLKNFRARMWLREDLDWTDEKYMGKSGAIRINVYANSDHSMASTDTTSPDDIRIERVTANKKYLFTSVTNEKYQYELTVPNEVANLDISVIPSSTEATVEITSLSKNRSYGLMVGDNFFNAKVISANKEKSQNYILKVTREKSSNTGLSSLTVDSYSLTPVYSDNVNNYQVTVPYEIETVTVNATKQEETETIKGLGNKNLAIGTNEVELEIKAEDGTIRKIVITIERQKSDNAGIENVEVNGYTLSLVDGIYQVVVPYNVTKVTLANVTTTGATVTGIGEKELKVGNNDYSVEVTSASGKVKTKYVIRVVREKDTDNTLKSLSLTSCSLDKVFASDTLEYSCTVENNITETTISATANSSVASITGLGKKTLVVGDNRLEIIVTAQNGVAKTYQVVVTRKANSDATLKSLTVSNGTLSPDFSSSTTSYTVSVPYSVTSLTVGATVNNSEASYQVEGNQNLVVGKNTITVTVTAGDKTEKTYTITVTREKDTINTLSSLSLTSCTLSPAFSSSTTSYTCTVENSVTSTTISATSTSSVASITGTGEKSLKVGSNTFTISVTSQSGSVKTYQVVVTRKASSDATLKNITVSNGTLSPTFSTSTTSYTVSVPYSISNVTVGATVNNSEASVTGTGAKELVVGTNTVTLTVTSGDKTKKTYTVNIIREKDTDNTLKSLSIKGCSLTPTFNSNTTSYTCTVENSVKVAEMSLEANSSVATLKYENQNLNVGENTINIVVTAQNGVAKTYQVVVTRKANSDATLNNLEVEGKTLTPEFNKDTLRYNLSVPYDVSKINIVGSSSETTSSIEGLGIKELVVGENSFDIKVTAEDKTTTRTYNVIVTREKDTNNNLKSLSLTSCTLSPAFSSSTTSYTCTVENSVTSTTISAISESSVATLTGTGAKSLTVGSNTFNISVTSQSGSIKTYKVVVTRKASSDATLKNLTVSSGTLSPTFNTNTISYTVTVPYSVSSITVGATVNNSEASVTGTGNKTLSVGENKINVVVTAGDKTTKTYTITVTREKDTDNTLKSLKLTSCTLSPSFSSSTNSYTCTVENSVTSTTVTAGANSSVAILTGTGVTNLSVGTNTIKVNVTAQNGSVKTYTVVVIRKPNSDATLKSLGVTNKTITPTFDKDTLLYTLTVPYSVDNITITGVATQGVSSVTGLGSKVLVVGENSFDIKVTAEDKTTTKTYNITVTRQKDTNTSLKSIGVTGYDIVKVDNNNYTLTVENNVTNVEVTATAASSVAIVTGTGKKTLNVGENVIKVIATSQSGSVSTYNVKVTRKASSDATLKSLTVSSGTLSPTFSASTTSYTVSVPYSVTSLTVGATVNNSEASVTGTGSKNLSVGDNKINVVVTAGDKTTKTYVVTVTRQKDTVNTLKSLSLTDCTLSPTFSSSAISYTCTVANSVTTTTVAAATSSSVATLTGTGSKTLNVGDNTLNIVVTSQSGSTKTYSVKVHRKSNDANLSSLSVTGYTISPTFSNNTTAYTLTVPNATSSITVNASKSNTYASISGTGSKTLNVGSNTIKVTVTAEDGNTKTYTITVKRKGVDTITLSAKNTTYTGSTIAANTATATSGTSITYTYYSTTNCSGTALSGAPTNVGNYSVKAVSTGNGDYEAGSKCVTHTITKGTPTLSLTAKSIAYTGSAIAANAATAKNPNGSSVTLTYTYNYYTNNTCTTAFNTSTPTTAPTNAGTYYVKATSAATSNLNSASTGCVTHTITKKADTVTLSAKSTTYTGSAIAANTATATSKTSITYTYYSTTNCSGTALSSAPTNVGNYSVKAVSAGNSNYSSGNKCVTHTITANTATVTINKGGSAWSDSGMQVALYSGTTLVKSAVTVSSGSTASFNTIPVGTYNVYATNGGKLVDTGVDIKITSTGTATINYYTFDLNYNVDGTAYNSGYSNRILAGLKINGSDIGYKNDYGGTYLEGTTWELYGYKIDNVVVSATASGKLTSSNPLNFTLYTINFSATGDGTVSPTTVIVKPGTNYSASGNTVTLSDGRKITATPKSITGYTVSVSKWSSTSGTVNAQTSLTATFTNTINSYTVTYDYNYLPNDKFTTYYNENNFVSCCSGQNGSITSSKITSDSLGKIYQVTAVDRMWYFTNKQKLTSGKTYTYQFDAKASENVTANIGSEQNGTAYFKIGTSWKRYTYTFTATDSTLIAFIFYGWTSTTSRTLYIRNLQFQEGNLNTTSSKLTYGSELGTTVTTPTRAGYAFGGWYTDPIDGTKISSTNTVPANNSTYYAHWTANALTFNDQSKTLTFNTSSQTTSITGASNGTGSYTYSITAGNDSSYFSISGTTITAKASTPAGTYKLTVQAKDNNSAVTKSATITITVGKKVDSITLSAKSASYTGNAIAANTATATSKTSITYTYYSTTNCSGTALSGAPTNVGNYSVKAVSAGNSNYSSGSKCVTHTITKGTPTISLTAKTAEATGSAITANAATAKNPNGSAVTLTYSYTYYSNNTCTTALSSAPSAVGTYYVKATSTATTNLNSASSSCVTHTINKNTNNNLSSLSISGYSISPSFAAGTTSYTATTEASSVTVNAKAATSLATVTGTGSKTLSWGSNALNVIVTSQSGAVKTYKITVNNKRPTAPTLTGGSSNWVSTAPTIKVSSAGTAISGVKHYEYYKSTSSTAPTDSTTATGTTSGNVTISDEGTTYIWYRTVSNNGFKSAWSSFQVTNLGTKATTIQYDNTKTGIKCNNVQCAIDALDKILSN